jgi:hypothetical protein
MNALGYLLLFLLFALPIAWLVAEFKFSRTTRILLGITSFIWIGFCVAGLIGVTTTFHYNIWYGENTKNLVDESVRQLEAGNTNQVLKAFKQLQDSYQPTYENRAKYNLLVSNAVNSMSQTSNVPH